MSKVIRKTLPSDFAAVPFQLPIICATGEEFAPVVGEAAALVVDLDGTAPGAEVDGVPELGMTWINSVITPVMTAAPMAPMAVHASPLRRLLARGVSTGGSTRKALRLSA
jgi:hypothetical protein